MTFLRLSIAFQLVSGQLEARPRKMFTYCPPKGSSHHLRGGPLSKLIRLECGKERENASEPRLVTFPKTDSDPLFHSSVRMNAGKRIDYFIYLPKQVLSRSRWPLLLALHGTEMRGKNLEKLKQRGLPRKLARGDELPFVIVMPQLHPGKRWLPEDVRSFVLRVRKLLPVDQKRLYLTGYSHGGFAAWKTAARYPRLFAAVAPICGGGHVGSACQLRDLPLWAFHGSQDRLVSPSYSKKMVTAIRGCGGKKVRFTLYPGVGHDSWTKTYDNPELYQWFLKHSL